MDIATRFKLNVPSHWMSALINGDVSGLEESELEAFKVFERAEIPTNAVLSPQLDSDGFFSRYHDARPYGVGACECQIVEVLNPYDGAVAK